MSQLALKANDGLRAVARPFSVRVTIPGKPVPKGRPRLGRGGTYTPKRTRTYEKHVAECAQAAMLQAKLRTTRQPVRVVMSLTLPIAKSWTKATRIAAVQGAIQPTSTFDIDNAIKGLLDGMNRVVYMDDSQVVELHAVKAYGLNPGATVLIEALQTSVELVA